MLKGVHLTLMMGTTVPVPVPQVVLDALTSVEVTTRDDEPSAFQLSFTLSNQSPLHTLFLLSGASPIPLLRVVLVATINGMPHVLIDGVVTNHEIATGSEGSSSKLTLTGEDLTAVMNLIDFSGLSYPAMPAEAQVAMIVAKYAFLGIMPQIIPSILINVPMPTEFIAGHQGTDLEYIQYLAGRVGYVFYIEPKMPPGTNIAYWGPQIKFGNPQPALSINMDAHTNVESLSFNFDGKSKGLPTVFIMRKEGNAPIPIPIPDITPLSPPLGAIPPIPLSLRSIHGSTKYDSVLEAVVIGMAKAAQWAEAVTADGTLDVIRYGHLLKARQLVGVRGAGLSFNGLYYVKSVTHKIKRGEYKQSFKLSRNGLVSTVQRVKP